MTKEEYERLLQTDYWKGYSYSLIKERNFICEDCGRQFPNERNKLQVHHLVYRDVNPWSYKPEELIVLCEDCHKRRHGIYSEPPTEKPTYFADKDNYTVSSEVNLGNHHYEDDSNSILGEDHQSRWPKEKPFKIKYILFAFLGFVAFMIGLDKYQKLNQKEEKIIEKVESQSANTIISKPSVKAARKDEAIIKPKDSDNRVKEQTSSPEKMETSPLTKPDVEVEDKIYKEETIIQSQPIEKEEGLSTIELLEKRSHANAIKEARRAGVSTEGSTIDILERISHANAIKEAKRAGVSTEGSTIDILERISHANAIKEAKRAGVSTEGSTIEILERISRKELEKYK